jgi:thioesterase domain-containing protein
MVPSSIVVVAEFPRTDRGKVDSALLQQIPIEVRGEHRAPQSDWEITIAEIWQHVLSIDAIGLDDDFFDLGGDSLAVEEVLSVLATIGPDLQSSVFIEAPTVEALARRVANAGKKEGFSAGIVRLRRGSDGPTIFCFAGAGGGALAFEFLARNLDETFAIWAVQMRGLEARGLPEFTVEQAARRFITELPSLQPNGPYVLCGHSYGGLVAYEVARRLRTAGQEVKLLALFDSYLPRSAVGQDDSPTGEGLWQRVRTKLKEWESLLPEDRRVPRWRQAWQMIVVGPLRYPGLAHFDILFNRGHAMTRRYQPEPYPGPTVVYMAARNLLPIDHLGWDSFLTGPWELVDVPGDHHSMLREPHVRALAADLNGRLHPTEIPAE